jgi:hypothetical protein
VLDRLRAFVREQAVEHASFWRKGVTDPGAETELLAVALDKLRALRLVVDAPDGAVLARPAIARYALDTPTIRDSQTSPGGGARRAQRGTRR